MKWFLEALKGLFDVSMKIHMPLILNLFGKVEYHHHSHSPPRKPRRKKKRRNKDNKSHDTERAKT